MHKHITSPPAPRDNSPDAQAELRYLRAEVAWLKRAEGQDGGKFQRRKALIIQELRREHELSDLLRAAGMARSTFYHNLGALRKTDKHQTQKERTLDIYHHYKGRYGYCRITLALRRGGCPINHKTVLRLMGELSLRAVIRVRKYRSWKGQVGKITPNRLQRDFTASSANESFYLEEFSSIPALREAIDAYIPYCNHERISLRLNDLSPVEFRLLQVAA